MRSALRWGDGRSRAQRHSTCWGNGRNHAQRFCPRWGDDRNRAQGSIHARVVVVAVPRGRETRVLGLPSTFSPSSVWRHSDDGNKVPADIVYCDSFTSPAAHKQDQLICNHCDLAAFEMLAQENCKYSHTRSTFPQLLKPIRQWSHLHELLVNCVCTRNRKPDRQP